MKVRAIDEQVYYNTNMMSITTGNVYEVEESMGMTASAVIVLGDDGNRVFLVPGEFEVVE